MALILEWPDVLRPRSVEWGLIHSQAAARSTFDSSAQAVTLGAARWTCTITTGVLRHDEVPEWEALIDQLDGMINRIRLWDWRRELPIGPATGAPVVRVSALGVSLQTEGWTPNVTGIIRAGSYLSVNSELKRLSATADSDALGRATLVLRPPLRFAPPVGTVLYVIKPKAKFLLTTTRPSMPQEGARSTGWTLTFEEDLTP